MCYEIATHAISSIQQRRKELGHICVDATVELKWGDFKPEYAGKMNFYCSVVDRQLRHATDQTTIGLILFQTKDRILAEYALKGIQRPVGVSDYDLTRALPDDLQPSLPSISELKAELSHDLFSQSEDADES